MNLFSCFLPFQISIPTLQQGLSQRMSMKCEISFSVSASGERAQGVLAAENREGAPVLFLFYYAVLKILSLTVTYYPEDL